MPRRHDAVGDELPLARRSEMAVDAHPRAHHRVFQLAKARAQIGEMLLAHPGLGVGGGADPGIMAGDPAAGGAVTRIARHPIPDRACPAARRRIAWAAAAPATPPRAPDTHIPGGEPAG